MLYHSNPINARICGWERLTPGGVWHSILPLIDTSTALLASMDLPEIESTAAKIGARLPNRAELDERNRLGFLITPEILPDADQRRAMPRDIAHGETAEAWEIRLRLEMGSLEWAAIETKKIRAQLLERKWDGKRAVVNAGKHPFRDGPNAPPPGRMYLKGWDPDGPGPLPAIQGGAVDGTPGPHNNKQMDYGTTAVLVFDGDSPPPPDPLAMALWLDEIGAVR